MFNTVLYRITTFDAIKIVNRLCETFIAKIYNENVAKKM